MRYKEPASLVEIINYIDQTLKRTDLPVDDIAGNIVGATLGNNSIEVRELFGDFPELYEITELAASLELTEKNAPYPHQQWDELIRAFDRLKERLV